MERRTFGGRRGKWWLGCCVPESGTQQDRLLERSISAIKVNYILYAFSP